jgi:hypothetical protein
VQGVAQAQSACVQVACVGKLLHGMLGFPLHMSPSQLQPEAAQVVLSGSTRHDRAALSAQNPAPASGGVQPGQQVEQLFAVSQVEQSTGVPEQRPGVD